MTLAPKWPPEKVETLSYDLAYKDDFWVKLGLQAKVENCKFRIGWVTAILNVDIRQNLNFPKL